MLSDLRVMNGFGPLALRKKVNGRVARLKRMGEMGSPCAIDEVAVIEHIVLSFMKMFAVGLSRRDFIAFIRAEENFKWLRTSYKNDLSRLS